MLIFEVEIVPSGNIYKKKLKMHILTKTLSENLNRKITQVFSCVSSS